MSVNYGDLEILKKLGEGKNNDYTTEQLLDENLKNIDGESNLEVRKRMLDFFGNVLLKYKGKRIVVVSHGAAIKFFLQHFCKYDYEGNMFIFKNQIVCEANLKSPNILRLVFDNKELISINKISF